MASNRWFLGVSKAAAVQKSILHCPFDPFLAVF
jgi:hypothetical protein